MCRIWENCSHLNRSQVLKLTSGASEVRTLKFSPSCFMLLRSGYTVEAVYHYHSIVALAQPDSKVIVLTFRKGGQLVLVSAQDAPAIIAELATHCSLPLTEASTTSDVYESSDTEFFKATGESLPRFARLAIQGPSTSPTTSPRGIRFSFFACCSNAACREE